MEAQFVEAKASLDSKREVGYFGFARHTMLHWLAHIECQEEDLSEIINTLAPINKDLRYFAHRCIPGEDRYAKLKVSNLTKKQQDNYMTIILAKFAIVRPDEYEGLKN